MARYQAAFVTAPVRQQQEIVQPQTEWPILADTLAIRTRCCGAQIIYEEGDPAECWYRVVSGMARRFNVRADGRRQIVDLLLPGDVFGFGARGRHAFDQSGTSATGQLRNPNQLTFDPDHLVGAGQRGGQA